MLFIATHTGTNIISTQYKTKKLDKLTHNGIVYRYRSGTKIDTNCRTKIEPNRPVDIIFTKTNSLILYGNSIKSRLHFIHTESTSNLIAITDNHHDTFHGNITQLTQIEHMYCLYAKSVDNSNKRRQEILPSG
jgi:hypothetical protein